MGKPPTAPIPGKKARCPGGYLAFIPDPLPPRISWTTELVRALSDADRLIGRLAGEGRRLPNPHLLVRPFVRREAVLSSRLEGTQATLGELLAAEAGAAVKRSPEDLREVGNYVAALEHGLQRVRRARISLRLLGELHATLMDGVHDEAAAPGEFRQVQNWIGPGGCTPFNASYVPPPPDRLAPCRDALMRSLDDASIPPLIHVAMIHYQFEAIHPFLDGNGRVGRLLIVLYLVRRGVLPGPLLYLSAFFEATRWEYYQRLRSVSDRGDWAGWIGYFLNGVARQSEDALGRAERINGLLESWRITASRCSSGAPRRLVDNLAANPFVTIRRAAAQLGVAFTTAHRAIEALQHRGIVSEVTEGRRDRVYCAKAILDVLEEPPRLTPTAPTP